MGIGYVHGYSADEETRLHDQATTLTGLLHDDTRYPPGSRVLEAGCGVGAQTVILAGHSPGASFTSVDISAASLAQARDRTRAAGFANVTFEQADLYRLPYRAGSFDHVFVCFVLEHLHDPDAALAGRAIQCLIDLQRDGGGDALIGRRLYPLLVRAGGREVGVSPRMVYVDASRPALAEGFTRKTFTAMVEGVGGQAVGQGLMGAADWAAGIGDLRRAAGPDGTFCYTFFKAVAFR
jgi:SAM-dependent methyltransferase